ncbi:MAG: glycoside hydrolase family 5 protein [Solirubrobacteraceae bacterium]|nr:glycoside hydrolase family 5 protein [Solirubrobacteraceae bacterium]
MNVARSVGLVLLAAVAAALPAAAHAGPVPSVRGVGIPALQTNSTLADIDADLNQAQALGADTVRVEVSWAALEPGGPGQLSTAFVSRLDHLVAAAHARHIKPLLLVLRTPCWATSGPACQGSSDYPPRSPSAYGSIAGRLAKRYKGRLAGFEVWNEPDHDQQLYFKGPDKPARYAAILKAAYAAIKHVDRGLPVLAGSLVGANGKFLTALYAQGIKGHYDGLAVHYYDLTLASLRAIRQTQTAHHDHRPVWLTEFGWTSCYPAASTEGQHACVTAQQQAQNLGDVFRALHGHSWIHAAIVYNLRDKANEHFGVLRADGTRKPSFAVVRQALLSGLGGPRGIVATVGGGRVTGTAPAGDIVTVQAYNGSTYLGQAIIAPDRFGRFSLAEPSGASKLVVAQPWTGRSTTLHT